MTLGSDVDCGLRLGEMIAMRLCHDMSGSLGTIAGGIELAREDRGEAEEALALAAEAAATLVRRLRLMRAAWGEPGGSIAPAELATLAEGLPRAHKIAVDFDALDAGEPFAAELARLMLNLLLLAAEGLPLGGVVALAGSARDRIVLRIEGRRAAWPAGLAILLRDEAAAWEAAARSSPRDIQAPLTALMAHSAGLRLSYMITGQAEPNAPLLLETVRTR